MFGQDPKPGDLVQVTRESTGRWIAPAVVLITLTTYYLTFVLLFLDRSRVRIPESLQSASFALFFGGLAIGILVLPVVVLFLVVLSLRRRSIREYWVPWVAVVGALVLLWTVSDKLHW